ncbi:palmitoyltransferase ZDHHC4-like [Asterias amurensis]|uniref:palmitoyltransferase ZDHHC4-like n=1 Tax=Asterias amurensis TaxID=7602 RepID=UPI003AB185F6
MADFLTLIIAYMVFFLLASYVILLGDSEYHRHGIIGKIRQATVQTAVVILRICLPRQVQHRLSNLITHVFFTRNHYIQAVYVIILSGIFVVFSREIYPRAKEYNLSMIHVISPFIGIVMNGLIFSTCCWSDPGVIDRKNYEECSNVFPYDGVMYQEGVRCSTCEFVKPARSKHCAYCNHCVYRFDHHCSWINNCIGGRNVRYFLLLLFSIATLTSHMSYISGCVLREVARESGIWKAGYYGTDGQFHQVTSLIVFQHLFMQLPAVVFLMTSLSLLSILITIFLFYHLYLLLTNQTTNERYKRSRVIGDVKMSSSQRSTKRRSRHGGGGASWNSVDVSYNKGLVRNIWEVLYPPI